MPDNSLISQEADRAPPRAGRNPFCVAVSAVLSGPHARPCGKPGNLHIPAGFEVMIEVTTQDTKTGGMTRIRSPPVARPARGACGTFRGVNANSLWRAYACGF